MVVPSLTSLGQRGLRARKNAKKTNFQWGNDGDLGSTEQKGPLSGAGKRKSQIKGGSASTILGSITVTRKNGSWGVARDIRMRWGSRGDK